jgi:hypothetical protein
VHRSVLEDAINGVQTTIGDLATNRYDTSLTATCFRLLDIYPKFPLAMVRVRDQERIQLGENRGNALDRIPLKEGAEATC